MGELVDVDLLLGTAVQERKRAEAAAAQDRRREAASRQRQARLAGNPAARTRLGNRWAPMGKSAAQPYPTVKVFAGDGPPPDPAPPGTPLGTWYLDRLTDTLYRLEP